MLSPRDIVYTGIFLDKDSQKTLLEKVPPLYKNIFAHHVTVKYKPTSEDIFTYELGKEYGIETGDVGEDDKGQAILINNIKTTNLHSHITISTAQGIQPQYSNDLLEKNQLKNLPSFRIKGKYSLVHQNGSYIYDFPKYNISEIQIPTRPQPDTLIAVFLLKKYASEIFQNLEKAKIEINPIFPKGENFESLLKKGILAIDFEESVFDHHNKSFKSAAESLSEWCNIRKNKEIQKLLEFAKRSEEGKGTISADALDKMFGLDGLIMALNRVHANNPKKVFEIVLPILDAHLSDLKEKLINTPILWQKLLRENKAKIIGLQTNIGRSRVVFAESDSQNLPGFLRSYQGERCDLFIQRLSSGHVNILSKANNNIDLSNLATITRQAESLIRKRPIKSEDLRAPGRIEDVPEWYYDKITNSILNGGRNAGDVEPTLIPWTSFEALVRKSFE